jgi:hypothetical protein
MRPTGKENSTLKYICSIHFMGEVIHNEKYASLKKLAEGIDIPYHTVTDVFEGRRCSYNKFKDRKFFPNIRIMKLVDFEDVLNQNDVGGLDTGI